MNRIEKYYAYTPVSWDIDPVSDDPFGKKKYYKIERFDLTERVIHMRYEIPQTKENYNIQLWITESDMKSTTEMGIEQENGIIKTFVYCTDTWHKDVWRQNSKYIHYDPLEGESPSNNRILNYLDIPVPTIGTLEFQLKTDRAYGFLENQFFGEIIYNQPNIHRISYGLEVYAPVITSFLTYKLVLQDVYYRKKQRGPDTSLSG